MLASTPLAMLSFSSTDSFGITQGFFGGAATRNELAIPQFEFQDPSEDGGLIPLAPSTSSATQPPQRDLPNSDVPKQNSTNQGAIKPDSPQENLPGEEFPEQYPSKESPPPESAGQVIPDDTTYSGNDGGPIGFEGSTQPTPDVTTLDKPSPREVRSVLTMLAALKYQPSGTTETVRSERAGNALEFVRQQRERVRDVEGGAVAVAVREIADELEAAPPQTEAAVRSLLDIAVPMDRSAGRYQAFEVLTNEEASFVPHDGLPVEEFIPAIEGLDQGNGKSHQTSAAEAQVIPVRTSEGGLSTTANPCTTEEDRSSIWSVTLGLVAFGFVLQLLPKRHAELLKSHARQIWQQLIAITGSGRRRAKVAPFPEI